MEALARVESEQREKRPTAPVIEYSPLWGLYLTPKNTHLTKVILRDLGLVSPRLRAWELLASPISPANSADGPNSYRSEKTRRRKGIAGIGNHKSDR